MTMLYNTQEHMPGAGIINARLLLHFVADSIKDWDCNCSGIECEQCPWGYSSTKMPENIKTELCLLEALKTVAYINLDPIPIEE